MIETERLILRPWREDDAEALYKYASSPKVGPIAGWEPHGSVDYSREVIRTVFSAPDVYALVLKESGEPIGCCGIMPADRIAAADRDYDAEVGYWLGVPYWGNGLIPEALGALMRRCYTNLGLRALWIGFRDGNDNSRRVAEKCGFTYHGTEYNVPTMLGETITEHFYTLFLKDYYGE